MLSRGACFLMRTKRRRFDKLRLRSPALQESDAAFGNGLVSFQLSSAGAVPIGDWQPTGTRGAVMTKALLRDPIERLKASLALRINMAPNRRHASRRA